MCNRTPLTCNNTLEGLGFKNIEDISLKFIFLIVFPENKDFILLFSKE